MAVTEEIYELVRLLDEEGFGQLAGELLSDLNVGRLETEHEDGRSDPEIDSDEDDDRPSPSVPFEPDEQLPEAVRFLHLRLVEPARRLVEAERIAAELSGYAEVRIRFGDEDQVSGDQEGLRAPPGDDSLVNALEKAVNRLINPAH
ncbi:hypothetical protein KHP60_04635 [Microvirga sp. 3-52]|uniref:hypothetical protein n=1 Tax=Microvirga sp. 3-52 TaxID=2792425 RepID=UPI001AD1BC34|nr:hypothetical protein [Microvirga sp. 3-52]MBO1904021.1 hypothetical protein [Microvirga sp. 3-52]MBS7451632.1 hypothetical protein [Microvirga sp. 3-52]